MTYVESKHSSIPENDKSLLRWPGLGPRSLMGHHKSNAYNRLSPQTLREERTKEEKVRYKSLRTASRRPRTCGKYLEGSDIGNMSCRRDHHAGNE